MNHNTFEHQNAASIKVDGSTTLVPLVSGHAEPCLRLFDENREHLSPWVNFASWVRTPADAAWFLATAEEMRESKQGEPFGIWQDGRLIGLLLIQAIDQVNRRAELAVLIAKNKCGNGIACRAVTTAVDYAFGVLGLHRLEIRCSVENAAAQRLALRAGFDLEGCLKDAELSHCRYVDQAVFGRVFNQAKNLEQLN